MSTSDHGPVLVYGLSLRPSGPAYEQGNPIDLTSGLPTSQAEPRSEGTAVRSGDTLT